MSRLFLYFLPVVFLAACVNAPDFPAEPVLTYEGVNKAEIFQWTNGPLDSITLQVSFTDGDGNLSNADSVDIFIEDSRFGVPSPRKIPMIPEEGTGNGISGDLFITIVNEPDGICCVRTPLFCVANPAFPVDTFSYSIQIRDRANNFSNVVRTEVIEIKCLGQ